MINTANRVAAYLVNTLPLFSLQLTSREERRKSDGGWERLREAGGGVKGETTWRDKESSQNGEEED